MSDGAPQFGSAQLSGNDCPMQLPMSVPKVPYSVFVAKIPHHILEQLVDNIERGLMMTVRLLHPNELHSICRHARVRHL
eukprot:scaffold22680_cov107-Cylindrotheca_fusiformis.AAC.21